MTTRASRLSRRDFLALGAAAAALPIAARWKALAPVSPERHDAGRPNFLILVFDTLSAAHLSLHGYRRTTSPNFERFAERATVFHHHTAAGNFTTPSTASLLTGVYPWAHRALQLSGSVLDGYLQRNLFSLFRPHYTTTVFTHNELVEVLFHQFREDLTRWTPASSLVLDSKAIMGNLTRDRNVAAWAENIIRGPFGFSQSSVFLSDLIEMRERRRVEKIEAVWKDAFPRGLPAAITCWERAGCTGRYTFLLEDALGWLAAEAGGAARPYVAYVHLFPPHAPYSPRREFVDVFDDGWSPPSKTEHFFSLGVADESLGAHRREYDEYIAYVDSTFGDLLDRLDSDDLLKDTYLIVTSDHGEMFERGIWQHVTETLYQPLLHIPLLIAEPGQSRRRDVTLPTSTVDLLPTLAHLAGLPAPDWVHGRILPGLGGSDAEAGRPVLSLEAKRGSKWARITAATASVQIGRYKLCQYLGYPGLADEVELYDLENDPEERDDLSEARPGLAADLQAVLRDNLKGEMAAPGWTD